MPSGRNALAARVVADALATAKVGVIVNSLPGVDPWGVAVETAASLRRTLHVAVAGYPPPAAPPEGVVAAPDVATAVDWRSMPDIAGTIVVFVQGEAQRLHSLADLPVVTSRDLATRLVAEIRADAQVVRTEPEERFWDALKADIATVPLPMVEDFVANVRASADPTTVVPANLWRLGLLPDRAILNSAVNAGDRLQLNRRLLEQMSQLSEDARRRIGSVLHGARGEEHATLRAAFERVKEYFNQGGRRVLQHLDLDTVEQLLRRGQPHSAKPPPPPVGGEDSDGGDADGTDDDSPSRPVGGRQAQQQMAAQAISGTPEARAALGEVVAAIRQALDDEEGRGPIDVPSEALGQQFRFERPANDLLGFIRSVCTAQVWGGVVRSDRHVLDDAVLRATESEITAYDPASPSSGLQGLSLVQLLGRLDHLAGLDAEAGFADAFARMATARAALADSVGLLLTLPFALFGADDNARSTLDAYLDAYSALLHLFAVHEVPLHEADTAVTKFVATQILRLDTVAVRTPAEWKAMLTPLHPIHIWRFREVLQSARDPGRPLTAEEQASLAAALGDLPHLLHFVVLASEVTGGEALPLPQAGTLGGLPTYENRTNRYLGNDGLDYLPELLKHWVEYAPYSRRQIRLGLVDVPDLPQALRECTQYLRTPAARETALVVDAYSSRGIDASGKLLDLDYEDKDHDLAELLRDGRLIVRTHRHGSIDDVAQEMLARPVHVGFVFDQSTFQLAFAPPARRLIVTPLVVTYEYEYSETLQQGTISPSNEAEDGLFHDFHLLVKRAGLLRPGEYLRLQYGGDVDVTRVNEMIRTGCVRWLVVADRILMPYGPTEAIPLAERRAGQREIGVWASATSRAVGRFVELLRRHPVHPDPATLAEMIRQFGHVAAGGLLAWPATGGHMAGRDAAQKGLIGTVFAAAWYARTYPDSLVASLDSDLARQWLKARQRTGERADLIGVRVDDAGDLVIEPIEVKTRADRSEAHEVLGPDRRPALAGRAVDQLDAMLQVLDPIFGGDDVQPLFTPARREVLKYQLFRECFREVHDPDWQRRWYERLRAAFRGNPPFGVRLEGLIVHVLLEENSGLRTVTDEARSIRLVTLGSQAINELVNPRPDQAPEEDAGGDGPDDEPPDGPPSGGPSLEPLAPACAADDPPTSAPPSEPGRPTAVPTYQPPRPAATEDLADLARGFVSACASYRVNVSECDPARAVVGPTVIRFYVRLGRGQRLDQLRNVLEDVGREMHRSRLLVEPVPNSNEISLDVPRIERQSVPMSRALALLSPSPAPQVMPIPIGVTPEGEDVVRRLDEMPHLLVGGTTGAGKTMFLYGLLLALITTHPDPRTLRLLLSTSKPEDFVFFAGLPHLETGDVISDAGRAIALLETEIEHEFERRLTILTEARCRDISEYNGRHPDDPLPPMVVVVDEFADLADHLGSSRQRRDAFYSHLRRIAQLGRSRGIHLVLCTQRPSADLVPTNIRNLMNGRVALHVNDAVASRMILDEAGAEQLQRHGDLLLKENAGLVRAQGYLVETSELEELVAARRQRRPG